ncbi:putative Ig domain-containing protein [Leptospira sp. GIMC2001]|uniref:putative Ig domain-containing protein n=1 Tax=Leptospira sp. GIMC2001 TaxID=1513297 RepID=UPI0023496034|nr:putative Ig domain-containing protein [Leptospira sp. GIMC2001]WCL49447.1 putative Ig domain-containing protein [Leptospira sp. GIMC2001]
MKTKYLPIFFLLLFIVSCPEPESEDDLSSLLLISALGGGGSAGTSNQPTVTSVTPQIFYIGSTITITGTNLSGKTVALFKNGVVNVIPTNLVSQSDTEVKLRITGNNANSTLGTAGISVDSQAVNSSLNLSFITSITSSLSTAIAEVNVTPVATTNTAPSGLSYTVSPALPSGLTFNTSAGTVSGTPTTGTGNNLLTYTLTGTNTVTEVGGSVTGNLFIAVVTNAQRIARTCSSVGVGGGCSISNPFTCNNSTSCFTTSNGCINNSSCGF